MPTHTSLIPPRRSRALTFGIILASLVLSSCSYEAYQASIHDYGTSLPIRPSGDTKVELYFDGEPFPNKKFIEGGYIGVVKPSGRSSRVLAELLRQKARMLGYDGVVDIEKHTEWKEEFTVWDFLLAVDGEVYPSGREYAILTGRGIKFVENIDYLSSVRRSQTAIMLEEGFRDTLFVKSYYPDGEFETISFFSDEGKKIHEDVIEAYDVQRLTEEEEGWEYYNDEMGRVQRRRHKRFDDWVLEKVDFKYEGQTNRLKEIRVTTPVGSNGLTTTTTLHVSQDDQGRIVNKKVVRYNETRWLELLTYDQQSRLEKTEIRRAHWTDKKIIVLYDYYRDEDVPELLKKYSADPEALSLNQ